MTKQLCLKVLSGLFMTALACPQPASAFGSITDDLDFVLNKDTTYIVGTVTGADTIAVIDFSLEWRGFTFGNLTRIAVTVRYIPDLLHFDGAGKNATNWPWNFNIESIDSISDTGAVVLKWTGGQDPPPENTLTNFGFLQFTPKCQGQVSENVVKFDTTLAVLNEISVGAMDWSPDTLNWTHGSVTTERYRSYFSITDTTSTKISSEMSVDVFGDSTNFRVDSIKQVIIYDSAMFSYAGATGAGFWDNFAVDTSTGDRVEVTAGVDTGATEFDGDKLYTLKFQAKCNAADPDYSMDLNFNDAGSFAFVDECSAIFVDDFYTNGGIAFNNAVSVKAELVSGVLDLRTAHEDDFKWAVTFNNDFPVGATDDEMFYWMDDDNLIILNMDGGDRFGLESGAIDAFNDSLDFQSLIDGSNNWILVKQKKHTSWGVTNWVHASTSYHKTFDIRFCWDTTGFTKPTTWDGRVLTEAPIFADSLDFVAGDHRSQFPDTVVTHCFVADSSNSLLNFEDFQKLEYVLCELSTSGYSTTNWCGQQWVYARNNFDLDSVKMRLTVPSDAKITGIDNLRTGVIATQVDDQNWDLNTNASFALDSAVTKSVLGRVKTELLTTDCPPPNPNKPEMNVSVSFSAYNAYQASDTEQYVVVAPGTLELQCTHATEQCSNGGGPGARLALDEADAGSALPREFKLHQNFPNPFNPMTKIMLDIPTASEWTISIYNIMGQRVETFSGNADAGTVTVEWNATFYASGVYFYKARAGAFIQTRKMLLLK